MKKIPSHCLQKIDTSPIRYINQLKQYWEAVKPRDTDIHYLIERSLAGPPGDWWQIIKDDVNNFQTFLEKFLKRYWNEQVRIDELIELLENFDRIGPININREGERAVVERERRRIDETKYNHQISIPQGQQSWRTQAGGNFQDKTRHPQPQNTSTWQRNTQGNYGNRMERNPGQNTKRPTENRSWRNNPQSTYQVRNMELETRPRKTLKKG